MKHTPPKFWSTPTGWAALALIAAASYFLVFEHGQHLLQFLPYLILLLCPLMHIFMHGSHGSHGKHGHEHANSKDQNQNTESFKELSDKNSSYRDGYIQGLEEGRMESNKKESNDG